MKTPAPRPIWLPLFVFAFMFAESARPSDSCQEAIAKVEHEAGELSDYQSLLKELNNRFDSHVRDDFNAQVDGVLNEIHRTSAVKIAYARKKLSRAIEERNRELNSLRTDLCTACAEKKLPPSKRDLVCRHCPALCR